MNSSEDLSPYFTGQTLYGDDFDEPRIAAWFRDEAEAYADLGAGDASQYHYVYHALNQQHGFAHTGKHLQQSGSDLAGQPCFVGSAHSTHAITAPAR